MGYILINLSDKTLERSLANEEIGRLLVPADILESNDARVVAVGLLHSSSEGCRLAGSLYGELKGGGLLYCGFLGYLPDLCHGDDL